MHPNTRLCQDSLLSDTRIRQSKLSFSFLQLLPNVLVFSLRHTYATLQLMDGRGIHELARQMGTSVAMIEQHYSKITPELMAHEFARRRGDFKLKGKRQDDV